MTYCVSSGPTHSLTYPLTALQLTKVKGVMSLGTSKSQCAQLASTRGLIQDLLDLYTSDKEKFCCGLVTGHETWIHHWDPESTLESTQWKHIDCPPPKKLRTQPAAGNSYDNNFGDSEVLHMVEYLPSK